MLHISSLPKNYLARVTDDQMTYHHNPKNGTSLVMSWLNTNLTFCKVVTPFTSDYLHISIPPDPLHEDNVR